ncbi:hypothetical protein CPB85DRAFT_1315487, partial [Mucidula mucida]
AFLHVLGLLPVWSMLYSTRSESSMKTFIAPLVPQWFFQQKYGMSLTMAIEPRIIKGLPLNDDHTTVCLLPRRALQSFQVMKILSCVIRVFPACLDMCSRPSLL